MFKVYSDILDVIPCKFLGFFWSWKSIYVSKEIAEHLSNLKAEMRLYDFFSEFTHIDDIMDKLLQHRVNL